MCPAPVQGSADITSLYTARYGVPRPARRCTSRSTSSLTGGKACPQPSAPSSPPGRDLPPQWRRRPRLRVHRASRPVMPRGGTRMPSPPGFQAGRCLRGRLPALLAWSAAGLRPFPRRVAASTRRLSPCLNHHRSPRKISWQAQDTILPGVDLPAVDPRALDRTAPAAFEPSNHPNPGNHRNRRASEPCSRGPPVLDHQSGRVIHPPETASRVGRGGS